VTVQLALRLEQPQGTPPLIVRANADQRTLRAVCDWRREGAGWTSANGWVRRAWIGHRRAGWAAFAPDGVPEWWAADPVTAMVCAEGGS
jgi:hypothetical protein